MFQVQIKEKSHSEDIGKIAKFYLVLCQSHVTMHPINLPGFVQYAVQVHLDSNEPLDKLSL